MLSVMISTLLLAATVTTSMADTDYCTITTCTGSQHTMCLYTSDAASSACPQAGLQRGVSAAEQTEILSAHNTIRQDVKDGVYANYSLPAAQTMPDLTWDDELATVAQRWIDQCSSSSHDQCP